MRALLVEDNDLLGSGLKLGLVQHDFTVDWVKDGKSALQALLSQNEEDHFDVVSITHGSNILGTITPIKEIAATSFKTALALAILFALAICSLEGGCW